MVVSYIALFLIIVPILILVLLLISSIKKWNNFKYWLKSGIIFAIIPLIYTVYIAIKCSLDDYFNFGGCDWAIVGILFGIILSAAAFLIGAVVGLIYGKIKKGKNSPQINSSK